MSIYTSIQWSKNATITPNNDSDWNSENTRFDLYRGYKNNRGFLFHKLKWLSQFTQDDSHVMETFIRKNLIYLSETDIEKTIESFQTFLEQKLYPAITDTQKTKFTVKEMIKRVTIWGLSDGARLDLVRYNNNVLKNHQFILETEISKARCNRIIKKIRKDTQEENPSVIPILVDDFSGSGLSYLRYENRQWKGKLIRFYQDSFQNFYFGENRKILIISPYYATEQAVNYLRKSIPLAIPDETIDWYIYPIHHIRKVDVSTAELNIMKKHYILNPINDQNYDIGSHKFPYLGFDECSLCVVFQHNTPNNSFPILWHGENAIFPRRPRHVDYIKNSEKKEND